MSETPPEEAPTERSELLASARALEDPKLKDRVRAAALEHARTVPLNTVTPARNLAVAILLDPTNLDASMLGLVVTDDAVAANIDVGPDGFAVNTDRVTDVAIRAAVAAGWGLVSAKYQRDPLDPTA